MSQSPYQRPLSEGTVNSSSGSENSHTELIAAILTVHGLLACWVNLVDRSVSLLIAKALVKHCTSFSFKYLVC